MLTRSISIYIHIHPSIQTAWQMKTRWSFQHSWRHTQKKTLTEAIRKKSMSQSLWEIGRPDLNVVFFFPWAADVSNLSRSQLCSLWNMELAWFMDEQDARQDTELKKSIVRSVLLCLSCPFMYILTSKFIKNWKKNDQVKKKIKAWILVNQSGTEKQTREAAFRYTFFFFSLTTIFYWIKYHFKFLTIHKL